MRVLGSFFVNELRELAEDVLGIVVSLSKPGRFAYVVQ